MDRTNPYEAAFEAYLKAQRLCYVGVDESRRAQLGDVPVKNLDFIVLGEQGAKLLVDVKGRAFPGGSGQSKYTWESWATRDDISGLTVWTQLFGASYTALFVFMYRLGDQVAIPEDTLDLWVHHGERYLLRAVSLADYHANMRVRSPKWGTVYLNADAFQRLVRPFFFFSHQWEGTFEGEDDGEVPSRGLHEDVSFALQAIAAGDRQGGSARR